MNDVIELDEGSVIGNYRVVRLLGQGGMGTVYEVEHLLGTEHYMAPEVAAGEGAKAKADEQARIEREKAERLAAEEAELRNAKPNSPRTQIAFAQKRKVWYYTWRKVGRNGLFAANS